MINFTVIDQFISHFDQGLRTLAGGASGTTRPNPVAMTEENELSTAERHRAARLIRVNHTGEVCAQALYHGQSLTATNPQVQESLQQAAVEENDHLQWCEKRLQELGGHTSVLNPLFYLGSFCLGAGAGKLGDRWNLGFLAETEHQVVKHLDEHLQRLPAADHKSRIVLETMQQDEAKHATTAVAQGAAKLPLPIRLLMQAGSKIMTRTTYWL